MLSIGTNVAQDSAVVYMQRVMAVLVRLGQGLMMAGLSTAPGHYTFSCTSVPDACRN